MHSLTIVFGPSPVPWVLLFRSEETVQKAMAALDPPTGVVRVADDFGQAISIRSETIHGIMLEDMELSKMAHIEQGLHRARTQAKAQEMGSADPVLRQVARTAGPAILQPGFPGGNGGAFRGQ